MAPEAAEVSDPAGPSAWLPYSWVYPSLKYQLWSSGHNDDPEPDPLGSIIAPGGSGRFTFETPPCSIVSGEGSVSTGYIGTDYRDTFPVSMKGPGPEITVMIYGANSQPATELKVAKWANSFVAANNPGYGYNVAADFITPDPDYFFVAVWDAGANTNKNAVDTITGRVKVSTGSNADRNGTDGGNTVTVRETGADTGIFVSRTLMLVSNQVDDEYQAFDVADNNAEDRTFRVKLGETVRAAYNPAAGGKPTPADVPVPVKKTVKVHGIIVRDTVGGPAPLTEQQAVDLLERANEQYAQVGVKLVSISASVVNPPAGVDISEAGNGLTVNGADGDGYHLFSTEMLALFDDESIRSAELYDIEINFVRRFDRDALVAGRTYTKGRARPEHVWYVDNIAIDVDKTKDGNEFHRFVVPHEIGHILTDGDHFVGVFNWETRVNLMKKEPDFTDHVLHSKRLFSAQQTATIGATGVSPKRAELLGNP